MKVILENELTVGLAYSYPRRIIGVYVFEVGQHLSVGTKKTILWSPDEYTNPYTVTIKRERDSISISCIEATIKERKTKFIPKMNYVKSSKKR